MDGTETEPAMVGKKAAQTSAKTPGDVLPWS